MPPSYFPTPADFRAWLSQHHASATELVVGFHKVGSGTPSMTWTESVREALCFGWIDGVRRSVDAERYTIRFTPRRRGCNWSAVNVKHVEELTAAGRMQPAGILAFEARMANKTGVYAFEQRSAELPEPYAGRLAADTKAATFFASLPAGYRKQAMWWIVSAKREATREARLSTLIACCARGERLP